MNKMRPHIKVRFFLVKERIKLYNIEEYYIKGGDYVVESTQKDKIKEKKYKGLIFVIVIVVLVFLLRIYYKKQLEPVSKEDIYEIEVDIPSGSTTIDIANILQQNNLIRNKMIFRHIVKKENLGSKLKAGKYTLNKRMNIYEILDQLVRGTKNEDVIVVNIPEGYELNQIAKKLSRVGLVDEKKFLNSVKDVGKFKKEYPFLKDVPNGNSLEGYLFPATYEFYNDSTEEEIICKMLDKFKFVYEREIKGKENNTGLTTNEIVTLASIVEREGKIDDERPIIAAVFYNRLNKDMLLQSCATVQYALGERKEKLSNKDIKLDSKYNTYIHKGLPPGPIASPGLKSIQAVINPAKDDYLYFVSKGDGSHVFSTSYEEHLKAKKSVNN